VGATRRPDRAGRDAREITEETGWTVTTGPILDSWMYRIAAVAADIFIVTYGCYAAGDAAPVISAEHSEVGLFTEAEVAGLNLPGGYRRSIATWLTRLRAGSHESEAIPGLPVPSRSPGHQSARPCPQVSTCH
jgi:hypothetical protein